MASCAHQQYQSDKTRTNKWVKEHFEEILPTDNM